MKNIPEALVTVYVRDEGVSTLHESSQVDNFVACARSYLERTLNEQLDPGAHRVLVNRIGADASSRHLRDGLGHLDRIEAAFSADARRPAEIRRIANEQRIDILIQAMRKASPGARLTAAYLTIRRARRLLSTPTHRYVSSKIWKRRTVTARAERRVRASTNTP